MDPPRPARHPFEVFDGVCDVDPRPIDSRLSEAVVEQFAGRSDKGLPGDVFRIAGLLADQHQKRILGALAEYGLGGPLVE